VCETGEAAREEICVIPAYCAILKYAFLPFQCIIEELELDNITAQDLYSLMEKLRIKISQRKEDTFIGKELEQMLLKLDEKSSISIKEDFLVFYDQSLKYLEKWFNFSDNYLYKIQFLSLKKEPTHSNFKEAVVVSILKRSINLNELYKEVYIIKPTLALFLNDKSKQTLC
jgi:hypothetical protein